MKRPQRISADEMAALAFDNPGREIELDDESGLAFLTVNRVQYVATYKEAEASS